MEKCDKCGAKARLIKKGGNRAICTWKWCKNKFDIWKNTLFYRAKIKKKIILRILEFWMQKASYDVISYQFRISRNGLWKIFKKVSRILVPRYYDAAKEIGGFDTIVEVDESKFGKRKYNRGRHVEGVWVLGMVEKTGLRRIKLVVVDDRSKETLSRVLRNNVSSDSVIYTDCWKGYNGLNETFGGHGTVNHSIGFKDEETGIHTNTIEGNWSGVKLQVPLRGRSRDKINLYLVRYMLLRNEDEHPLLSIVKYLF